MSTDPSNPAHNPFPWGGSRPGAGRKPKGGKRITVRVPSSIVAQVESAGGSIPQHVAQILDDVGSGRYLRRDDVLNLLTAMTATVSTEQVETLEQVAERLAIYYPFANQRNENAR